MTANITFNPVVTTNAFGSFNVQTAGYIQGMALDQPAVRFGLSGGLLSTAETLPMWGGLPIVESIPTVGTTSPRTELGGIITRATAIGTTTAGITGWSVFDQQYAAINSPQSPVPLVGSLGQVNFYRTGSGARIAVACDPALASAYGGAVNSASVYSWNFPGGFLQPYLASGATFVISSMTYATTNGGQIAIVTAADASVTQVGDIVVITGATTNGSGGNNAVNGTFIVNTFTSNTHFTVSAPNVGGQAYYGSSIGGSPLLNESGGDLTLASLFLRVLEVQIGNSFTVNYNLGTGFATWNQTGSTAIILV